MALLVGKSHYLVLNAGTIARSDALDHARIEGRAGHIGAYDFMGFCIGIDDVAGQLIAPVQLFPVRIDRKGIDLGVSRLDFQL